ARYSLEMLMALLDERDKMIIMPMNDGRTGYAVSSSSAGIEVDLAAEDREAVERRCGRHSQMPCGG
ncbi:MAG: hypothetical protein IJP17_04160, partial [Clostridia bacterium]|nr:hypothetical protein [Clostridia bacterium]